MRFFTFQEFKKVIDSVPMVPDDLGGPGSQTSDLVAYIKQRFDSAREPVISSNRIAVLRIVV